MAKANSFQKGDETRKKRKSQLERIQEMKSHMEDHTDGANKQTNTTVASHSSVSVLNLDTTNNTNTTTTNENTPEISPNTSNISSSINTDADNASFDINNNMQNDIYNPDNVDLNTFFDSKNTMSKNITRTFSIDVSLVNFLNSIAKSKKLKRSVFYRTLIGIAIKEELSNVSNNSINGGNLGRKKKAALTISIPLEYDEILKKKIKELSKEYPDFTFTKSDIMEVLLTNISKRFS